MKMTKFSGKPIIITQLFQLLLLFMSTKCSQAHECPHPCTCQDAQNLHVNCSSKLLLTSPKTSMSTLTLDLSQNALGPILNVSFVQMRNLTLIDLSQNALTILLDCTFSGMLGLTSVYLNGNRLNSLPDGIFTDSNKVEHLDLSHNLFVELPHNIFKNLPQLKTFDVSHNLIVQVKFGLRFQVPRHIQTIDLSHNHIEAIKRDSFEIASAWETGVNRVFNLAFCRISSIEGGAITQIPNLNDLDISGNSGVSMQMLTALIKELETGARNLDRLSLAYMNLTTLVPLFTDVTEISLKFLNVSFNSINDVPANLFSTIRSLRVLDLSRNNINTLADGFSDLVNLRVLNVSHNNLHYFHGAAVIHLSNLYTLDASHNKLVDSSNVNFSPLTKLNYLKVNNNLLTSVMLPTNTSNLQFLDYHSNRITEFSGIVDAPILEVVDLSDNDLESVAGFLFRGARFLKMANFSKNSIEAIDHRAFLPQSPLCIDLSHNFLKEIRYSNWVATQKLYLNHNNIVSIDNQAFHGMTGLEELDLSKNELVTLQEDLFHYLTNLKYLNLSYNGLNKLLWLHLFHNLEQLETLDLGHNNITDLSESMLLPLVKIKSLYLQVNALRIIIPRVFRDVPQLKIIDLSSNPFDCVCDMLALKDWLKRTKISVLGLYTINSTAYHCVTPFKRAGVHILDWNEEEFECNKSMLYLIIVCFTGGIFIVLVVIATAVYRGYKNYKWKAEVKKKLKQEEENRRKRKKRMNIVQLSNQEIAEAIKDAVERKSRQNRQKSGAVDRYDKHAQQPGHAQRLAGQEKGKMFSENVDERKEINEKDRNMQKGRGRSREEFERQKMEELVREELNKKRVHEKEESSHTRQYEKKDIREDHIEKQDEIRLNDNTNFNQYISDRNAIPSRKFRHPNEDLTGEVRVSHQDRIVYYKRDPRYWHTVGPERRHRPYIISPANILPNKVSSADTWNLTQGGAYQGYRRSRQQDNRMVDYTHNRDVDMPRYGRENKTRERVNGHKREIFPSYTEPVEGESTHYTSHGRYDPYYDYQRSQSYSILPQDHTSQVPYVKRDRLQRQFESINKMNRYRGIGPRAVSQPYLATETSAGWL